MRCLIPLLFPPISTDVQKMSAELGKLRSAHCSPVRPGIYVARLQKKYRKILQKKYRDNRQRGDKRIRGF